MSVEEPQPSVSKQAPVSEHTECMLINQMTTRRIERSRKFIDSIIYSELSVGIWLPL